MNKSLVVAATLGGLVAFGNAASADIVYSNNFNGPGANTDDFSAGTIVTSPNGTAQFLGPFAQGASTTLTLTGLAPFTSGTISFDVDVILSMDGDGEFGGGRDQFLVTGPGGTLLNNDFANFPGNTQDYPVEPSPPFTGDDAALRNTFGYAYNGDPTIDNSVYSFDIPFTLSGDSLSFTFAGNTSEGVDNEFYGIDNVVVTTNGVNSTPVPEPASATLLAAGLAALAAVRRRRRDA